MVDFLSATTLRILGTRDDTTALAAIDTTILKTGAGVYVSSVSGLYLLDKSSTAAADGTAVVAPVNGRGRWFLQGIAFDVLTQTAWAIDPINGDDSGPGTLAEPLLTGAEFTRRTYGKGITELVTVDLLNPWPDVTLDYIAIASDSLNNSGNLLIRGAEPAPTAAGEFTVVNNAVADTSLTTVQTDIDLSGFVDYRLRITSSATAPVGTTMWIEAESAGVATLSAPTFVNTSNPNAFWSGSYPTLTVGDTFVVEKPNAGPQLWGGVGGVSAFASGFFGYAFRIENLRFVGNATLGTRNVNGYAVNCKFEAILNQFDAGLAFDVLGCRFAACQLEGIPRLSGCSVGNLVGAAATAFSTNIPGSKIFMFTRNSVRGLRYEVIQGRLFVNHGGGNANGGLSVHQWLGTGGGLRVGEGALADLNGIVWGASTNANTYGLQVDSLGGIAYDPATKPTITGATADTRIGTTNRAYAAIPVFDTTFGAGIVEHQD